MKPLLISIIVAVILTTVSCKDDEVENVNLITNSSFENNGQNSFQGWAGNSYTFVNDVPTDGGVWALQLEPGWSPDKGFAETFITGYSGDHTFRLTCDAKTILWDGEMILSVENQEGIRTELTKAYLTDSVWTTVELEANVSLQQTDKLFVRFSAGSTEVVNGKVLLDKISLQEQ